MSANPVTTFDLVDANTMSAIWPLTSATGRSFKPVFNGPGTLDFTLPLDDAAAYYVRRRAVGVKITRNDRPIWSGGVTNVSKSAKANAMQVTATGWLEEFDRRFVRKSEEATLSFAAVPGGQIIQTLVATCNAQQDSSLVTRPLRVSFGSRFDTQVRTRSYHAGDSYGAAINELVAIENGCDLRVDALTRRLSTFAPTAYVDRTSVRFGWGVEPFNLEDAVETTDGTALFNRESVVTAGGVVVYADDPVAIADAGVMLEEWTSLSDVADSTIAAAFANAELVAKRYGLITYQITPASYGDLPRPYEDFEWGDQGYLSVSQGALQVAQQPVRLFAGTISYSDQGDEIVSELEVALA